MWSLVKRLGRVLHSWWRGDRIRASPGEGRLLHLAPRSIVIVNARAAVVVEREIATGDDTTCIVYRCEMRDGDAWLEVRVRHIGPSHVVRWHEHGLTCEVTESDVEVFTSREMS